METQNPYSAPKVEQTLEQVASDVLFEYSHSSRNRTSLVACMPIAFGSVAMLRMAWLTLVSPVRGSVPEQALLAIAYAVMLIAILSLVVWPRVFEFRVDRELVSWRKPWPRAYEVRLPVTSIERVDYQGNAITILTTDGNRYQPKAFNHGYATEEVVEAIAAAVSEREPQTTVRKTRQTVRVSWMRSLGRAAGSFFRLFRKH